jgi:hypothetical protein
VWISRIEAFSLAAMPHNRLGASAVASRKSWRSGRETVHRGANNRYLYRLRNVGNSRMSER